MTDNPLIIKCVNKIETRITFKFNTGYYIELLTTQTMKLPGSTKNKITKNENGENVPHLEIAKVVLVDCIIANNDYQQHLKAFYTFVHNISFGQLLEVSTKSFIF